MINLFKMAALTVVGAISVGSTGCATGNRGEASVASAGMMCPKCETVWVTKVVDQGTKVQRLSSQRNMACPDCDEMAKSQLTGDGKVMLHECPTCNVAPQFVKPTMTSHPKGTH